MNKVYYAEAVYNNKEINAVTKVLKTQRLSLMDGKNVKIFESKNRLELGSVNINNKPKQQHLREESFRKANENNDNFENEEEIS